MAGFKFMIIITSLICILLLLYGIIFTVVQEEKNLCRMTYMFEYPQFVKINFVQSKYYPKYGLYVYSEGALTERTRAMDFTGAPVIFVPGNGGSFKQARSLASVAIRKGIDNEWIQHLDYFAVDYNEEYSGLFGGYLENQKNYLKFCISAVLNLYRKIENPPKQVILIGHSMGGKIAQSLLIDEETEPLINTIITLATPIDKPVINLDVHFNEFYDKINKYIITNRTINNFITDNTTNICHQHWSDENTKTINNFSLPLDNKLIISIGGGNRDVLVHSSLTLSKSSDINVLTTTIPNVWLTTDHLCSVWCLQLVLVINRFLHSVIEDSNRRHKRYGQKFIEDKSIRLMKAYNFFVRPEKSFIKKKEITLSGNPNEYEWIEDSRRVYSKIFDFKQNKTSIQMIRLIDLQNHKYLAVTAININNAEWIFGCAALEVTNNMRFCSKALSLSEFSQKLPPHKDKKSVILLDLHKIQQKQPTWTHVILRYIPAKQKDSSFNIDIFDPASRFLKITTPKWYLFSEVTALEETLLGSSFYKLEISGLDESYQTLEIHIKPRICSKEFHHSIVKICIPWLKGCEKFQHLTNIDNQPIFINIPTTKPSNYNTTENPIAVYMHLDGNCRYKITYQNSFGGSLSQILKQYVHWLPAHLTTILLMALRHQISITPTSNKFPFKCGKLHIALLSCSSFFIVTTTRIFAKMFIGIKFLPDPDNFNNSMLISVILHGSAFAIITFLTVTLWLFIYIYGNIAHKILLRIILLPLPSITDSIMPFIEKIPISAGILLVSIATAACGGISLICGCLIYFMLIVKQYEDYLEEYVFNTAKLIASKLFAKIKSEENNETKKSEENDKNTNTKELLNTGNPTQLEAESLESEEIKHKSEILLNTLTNSLDTEFPENVTEEELDKLLADAIEKQKKIMNEKKIQEQQERAEYDLVHDSFSSINFHITMFLLLCILTLLNLPSTISWAKNYSYNQRLSPDPSLIPAYIALIAISILWQFSAPRNVQAYKALSHFLYMFAASCILFCQDSVYRLNGIICGVFIVITIHQLLVPKKLIIDKTDSRSEDNLMDKIDQIKNLLVEETANEEEKI